MSTELIPIVDLQESYRTFWSNVRAGERKWVRAHRTNYVPAEFQKVGFFEVRCGRFHHGVKCDGLLLVFDEDNHGRLHIPKPEAFPHRRYIDEQTRLNDYRNDNADRARWRYQGLTADHKYLNGHGNIPCPKCGAKLGIKVDKVAKILRMLARQFERLPYQDWETVANEYGLGYVQHSSSRFVMPILSIDIHTLKKLVFNN